MTTRIAADPPLSSAGGPAASTRVLQVTKCAREVFATLIAGPVGTRKVEMALAILERICALPSAQPARGGGLSRPSWPSISRGQGHSRT
jgi:hypothetical protein